MSVTPEEKDFIGQVIAEDAADRAPPNHPSRQRRRPGRSGHVSAGGVMSQEPNKAPPSNCRQQLAADGKPYPRSSCAVCGQFSPRWKECDALLAAAPVPPAGEVEVLAVVTLGSFSSEELGEIDVEPQMKTLERLQQQLVTSEDVSLELVDGAHVTRLTAEDARLHAEVERLKNLDHRQILAESAAKYLLDSGAENFIGEVFTIEADDGVTKFEVVVTTQKVGAKSPSEVCNELQSELTKARECISAAVVLLASRWTMPDDLSAWRKSASECLARQPAHNVDERCGQDAEAAKGERP